MVGERHAHEEPQREGQEEQQDWKEEEEVMWRMWCIDSMADFVDV